MKASYVRRGFQTRLLLSSISFFLISACASSNKFGIISVESKNLNGLSQLNGTIIATDVNQPRSGSVVDLESQSAASHKYQELSNHDGVFLFKNVLPGVYAVKIRYIGYEKLIHDSVSIQPNTVITVHYKLKPAVLQIIEDEFTR